MPVAGPLRPAHVGAHVVDGVVEVLGLRADDHGPARAPVLGLDLAKGVAGLRIDKVEAAGVQGLAEVDVERVAVEVAVDARDGDEHGAAGLGRIAEEHAVEQRTTVGGDLEALQSLHLVFHAYLLKRHTWPGVW